MVFIRALLAEPRYVITKGPTFNVSIGAAHGVLPPSDFYFKIVSQKEIQIKLKQSKPLEKKPNLSARAMTIHTC
jgi:hypothetical protein